MFRLEVSHTAHLQMGRLPAQTQERLHSAIARLGEKHTPPGARKLTARDGYRVRVGDYRVLYQVDGEAKVVIIYRVMSRVDVYRV